MILVPPPERLLVLFAKTTLGQPFEENINIFIHTLSSNLSINQYLRLSLENLRKLLGVKDFDIASVDERSQSALVQFSYNSPFPNPNNDGVIFLTSTQRMVISNGVACQVTVTQPASALSDYGKQVMYRNVLNSFVLISSGKEKN